uniref:Secreted protein n=1 Tax=Steinernema glaseri TaxID=37863 RepID=A0A1I8AFW8_9BILA
MLLLFLLSLLLHTYDARYEGKRLTTRHLGYQEYYMDIEYIVHTADVLFAGTISFLKFSYGYIKEDTNVLLYLYSVNVTRDYPGYDRISFPGEFLRDTTDNHTGKIHHAVYDEVESACAREMNNKTSYEICLTKPNVVVIFATRNVGHSYEPECEWMLDNIKVNVTITRWEKPFGKEGKDWRNPSDWNMKKERVLTGRSYFLPNQQWIEYGWYYFRSSPDRKPRNVFKGFMPKVGQVLNL